MIKRHNEKPSIRMDRGLGLYSVTEVNQDIYYVPCACHRKIRRCILHK